MAPTKPAAEKFNNSNLLVWVLAPEVKTENANLDYYYDYTQSIQEFSQTFEILKLKWKWQPVNIDNCKSIISGIATASLPYASIVFNLCDGDEINNTPGISVIRELEKHSLPYTGANEFFYDATTSKITMKKLFDLHDIPTPKWKIIPGNMEEADAMLSEMKLPVIVKPAISGGSMGVGVKSVVHTAEALQTQVKILNEGYHGWDLASGGIIIEEFIEGPEFTVLITGSWREPGACKVYSPVERVFHKSLPEEEKFLSFDRLWEIYEDENAMEQGENFYDYHIPQTHLIEQICKVSLDAYCAVRGEGYARIDVRMDSSTGKMHVLEVNAQCGLSEDENYTSIGAILRLSKNSFSGLIWNILESVINRQMIEMTV